MTKLQTCPILGTELELPRLGFGGAPLGGLFSKVDMNDAKATLERAFKQHLHYVDTAPFYGIGRSERIVGDVLRGKDYILSTKVGRLLKPGAMANSANSGWPDALPFNPVFDYSYDGIMRSFEDSQQRLGLDKIDILYVHDLASDALGDALPKYFAQLRNGGIKALEMLKKNGNIKAYGLGTNQIKACEDVLEIADWDIFLLAGRYTLLEQNALNGLFQKCQETQTSVIIGGPYNSGILVGGHTWNYDKAPEAITKKVNALKAVSAEFNIPLPAAALQFPLAHPIVSSVIPGLRSIEELEATLKWAKIPIMPEFWQALKQRDLLHPDAPTPTANPFYEV